MRESSAEPDFPVATKPGDETDPSPRFETAEDEDEVEEEAEADEESRLIRTRDWE